MADVQLQVTMDQSSVDRTIKTLLQFEKRGRAGIVSALVRAGETARSIVATETAASLGIRKKILLEAHPSFTRIGKAAVRARILSTSEPAVKVSASSRRVPVGFFPHWPRMPQPGRRVKQKYRKNEYGNWILKNKPGAAWQIGVQARKEVPGSFVAQMKSGHIGVFKREPGAKRLKIIEFKGPSVGLVASKAPAIADAMRPEGEVAAMIVKRLNHELGRVLKEVDSAASGRLTL